MSHQIKDIDYLSISTRIRAMENRLLTRERMDRMIDARENGEAMKILTECGYPEDRGGGLEGVLAQARADTFRDIAGAVPDPRLAEIFQLKYDYHNAKVILKAQAVGADPERLLLAGGRYDPRELLEGWRREELGSPFLLGYVRLSVDVANLRTAVRAARMGKEGDFLRRVLLPGGNVSQQTVASARADTLGEVFQSGPLAQAAQLGAKVALPGGGSLTAFEKACDDALTAYLAAARMVPFGEQTVIGYLYAKELEFTAVRTIFAGRAAGLDGDTIRARLRQTYV